MKRARDLLADADAAQLGPSEIELLVDLLLSTGHPDQAREVLSEGWRAALGLNYEWFKVLIGAACGNYQQARPFLDDYVLRTEQGTVEGALRLLQAQALQGGLSPASLYGTTTMPNRLRQLADWRVLRGLLALEEGDNAAAAKAFQAALDLGEREQFHFESRPLAL